ncbi:MAG: S24/S26 family peptidase [Prevotella sp.]|nr:S24/S26 family peptidase [Prevotella sp.]
MKDEVIIEEAIRMVNEGVSVTFPVRGSSMLPFITGGRDSVILQRPACLKVGDVVLAWADGFHYVVHRIIALDGDRVTLMGDGNIAGVEHCTVADVKALASHVVKPNGRHCDLQSPRWMRAARWWYRLRPIRRYILAIYRRVI